MIHSFNPCVEGSGLVVVQDAPECPPAVAWCRFCDRSFRTSLTHNAKRSRWSSTIPKHAKTLAPNKRLIRGTA